MKRLSDREEEKGKRAKQQRFMEDVTRYREGKTTRGRPGQWFYTEDKGGEEGKKAKEGRQEKRKEVKKESNEREKRKEGKRSGGI